MSISQGMSDVRARMRQGVVGEWVLDSHLNRYDSGLNQDPQRVKIATLTIGSAVQGTEYGVSIGGYPVTWEADDTDTTNNATQLAAAINANPLTRGLVIATASTNVVTITGLYPGIDYEIADASGTITPAVTQAADEADPIPFGVAVISDGRVSGEATRLVKLAASGGLTAQVVTADIAYVASAIIQAAIFEARGGERHLIARVQVTSATDRDTMINAIVDALNDALPANTVLAEPDAGSSAEAVVLTAEVAGLEFVAEFEHLSGGASSPAIAIANTTGPNTSTSLHRALKGISLYSHDPAPTIGGTAGEYGPNAGVRWAEGGEVWVEDPGSVTEGGTVYIELGPSGTGRPFAASSATRVALSRQAARWVRAGHNSADGIAALRLDL